MRFSLPLIGLSSCYLVTKREACEHDQRIGDPLSEECQELLGVSPADLDADADSDTDSDTDADTDADSDADSDADTDTSTTGETGTVTETGDTGVLLGQLCVSVAAAVSGPVQIYVFETNFDDVAYWVNAYTVPVVGTAFATGDASTLICGDMARVPYVAGHTLLVLGTWDNGSEQSLVTGNAAAGYLSSVQEVTLSGLPLVCTSSSNLSVAPYAYTSCTL